MQNYYELLNIKVGAGTTEATIAFRRIVARYRATTTTDQIIADQRFRLYINAYLTLSDSRHNTLYLEMWKNPKRATLPDVIPLESMQPEERRLIMAQIAFWRNEQIEALHILRDLLERNPKHASAHALMGEIYFQVDRIDDGVRAYQYAVLEDPQNATYAERLHHAQQAQAGVAPLYVEPSIEEQLLAEERRQRRWKMVGICSVGLLFIIYVFVTRKELYIESFHVPWKSIFLLTPALFLLMYGLAYGRMLDTFEQVMVFSGMSVGARGSVRNYPYGLLLFVTCTVSLWLGVCYLIAVALCEEEWPVSTSIMIGICVVITLTLAAMVNITSPYNWVGTFVIGGNLLAIAGLIGWWAGSMTVDDSYS